MLRVSVADASLNGLTCAATCASASPNPNAAIADPADTSPCQLHKVPARDFDVHGYGSSSGPPQPPDQASLGYFRTVIHLPHSVNFALQ